MQMLWQISNATRSLVTLPWEIKEALRQRYGPCLHWKRKKTMWLPGSTELLQWNRSKKLLAHTLLRFGQRQVCGQGSGCRKQMSGSLLSWEPPKLRAEEQDLGRENGRVGQRIHRAWDAMSEQGVWRPERVQERQTAAQQVRGGRSEDPTKGKTPASKLTFTGCLWCVRDCFQSFTWTVSSNPHDLLKYVSESYKTWYEA